jgi:hypothetical protein
MELNNLPGVIKTDYPMTTEQWLETLDAEYKKGYNKAIMEALALCSGGCGGCEEGLKRKLKLEDV